MGRQLMEASVILGTDADAGIDLYQSASDVRLYVLAADGSARVDFVHRAGCDREQSVTFLQALTEHALHMATAIATVSEPTQQRSA